MPLGGQVELRPALQGAYKVYLCIVGCYLVISKCPRPPGIEQNLLEMRIQKLTFHDFWTEIAPKTTFWAPIFGKTYEFIAKSEQYFF